MSTPAKQPLLGQDGGGRATFTEWTDYEMPSDLNIAFLGSGRCFHTFDWYRSSEILLSRRVPFITDNYEGDGLPTLFREGDDTHELLIIDRILSPTASMTGHKWRNLVKFLAIPLQILLLRRRLSQLGNPFVLAHSTYYAFLASFANVRYAAVPQGSEVLVRPNSRLYRWLLKRSVKKAQFVTVDSEAMRKTLGAFTDRPIYIIQNGINVCAVQSAKGRLRDKVISIRAISSNYRILEIIAGRNQSSPDVPLTLTFPFTEADYLELVEQAIDPQDRMRGCVDKSELYELMAQATCVFSVPGSDSSPRSVYEAIFGGAAVALAPAQYIEALPACMRARVVVVDIGEARWFAEAMERAQAIVAKPFHPSEEALDAFDQVNSMGRCLDLVAQFSSGSVS